MTALRCVSMSTLGPAILKALQRVDAERALRDGNPALGQRVHALKLYQQRRFAHGYADLLADPRYGGAARFFLEELYGPRDYRERDAQFVRVVPALVRLFPEEVVRTVVALSELHALSESLDTAMALALAGEDVDAAAYVRAWQSTARAQDRERQIELTLEVGEALDAYTRNPWLRNSLRMMRGPARVAGLSELQHFLEAGFDTFRAMRGAASFLAMIGQRERALKDGLFAADTVACVTAASRSSDGPLGQLP